MPTVIQGAQPPANPYLWPGQEVKVPAQPDLAAAADQVSYSNAPAAPALAQPYEAAALGSLPLDNPATTLWTRAAVSWPGQVAVDPVQGSFAISSPAP